MATISCGGGVHNGCELNPKVIDQLLAGCTSTSDLFDDNGLFKQLKKQVLERLLASELTQHLGYRKGAVTGRNSGNSRNGHSAKTVLSDDGALELAIPRDRNGTFEPEIVPNGSRRLDGFDDRIVSLYARGLTVREIQGHLREMYGLEVSADLISRATEWVATRRSTWRLGSLRKARRRCWGFGSSRPRGRNSGSRC